LILFIEVLRSSQGFESISLNGCRRLMK